MAESQRKRDETRGQGQVSSVQVMFGAILAVGLLLAINFSTRIAAGQPLQDAYDKVIAEIDALRAEQAQLIHQRDFVLSDAYVASWARDEGKMVREGEVLVVPVPSGAVAVETPAPGISVPIQTTDPDPEPWQLWWGLFFDTEPPRPGE